MFLLVVTEDHISELQEVLGYCKTCVLVLQLQPVVR